MFYSIYSINLLKTGDKIVYKRKRRKKSIHHSNAERERDIHGQIEKKMKRRLCFGSATLFMNRKVDLNE